MDLFALGTPVIDLFARVDWKTVAAFGITKGATSFFSAKRLSAAERMLGKRIAHRYAGDNARNVCEGFAALGGFAGYQGAVGRDAAGAQFAANLRQCGIADFLQVKKGATGRIIALVTPDGQRTFCADLGVSTQCKRMEGLALENSRMFFVASITLAGKFRVASLAMDYLEACRKVKKAVAISLESPPMVAKNRKLLLAVVKKYADVLFVNEQEAEALLGRGAGRKLLALKPGIPVYLKMGRRGSALFLRKKRHPIRAIAARAVDTTGAGDAYAAGVLYGLSRKYSPLSSAKIGTLLAAKVVQKVGAGIPLAHTRIRIRHHKS